MVKQNKLSIYLPKKLDKTLGKYSEKLCLSKSAAARMIINDFFVSGPTQLPSHTEKETE